LSGVGRRVYFILYCEIQKAPEKEWVMFLNEISHPWDSNVICMFTFLLETIIFCTPEPVADFKGESGSGWGM
jgi:hypothetical protein